MLHLRLPAAWLPAACCCLRPAGCMRGEAEVSGSCRIRASACGVALTVAQGRCRCRARRAAEVGSWGHEVQDAVAVADVLQQPMAWPVPML